MGSIRENGKGMETLMAFLHSAENKLEEKLSTAKTEQEFHRISADYEDLQYIIEEFSNKSEEDLYSIEVINWRHQHRKYQEIYCQDYFNATLDLLDVIFSE